MIFTVKIKTDLVFDSNIVFDTAGIAIGARYRTLIRKSNVYPLGIVSRSIVIQKYSHEGSVEGFILQTLHSNRTYHMERRQQSSLSICIEKKCRPLILAAVPTHTSMAEPEAAPEVKEEVKQILFECKCVLSR